MFDAVSAGHICLDMTPVFFKDTKDIFVGGKLTNIGEMKMTTGGSASNTGIALSKLGLNAPIMAKVGKDMLGDVIINLVKQNGVSTDYFVKSDSSATSYTIVLAPPQTDRMFLHNPGVNDTFVPDDVKEELLSNTRLFHFGYPTLMKSIYSNNGENLIKLFKKAKEYGTTTSMDLTLPDPTSECGMLDWKDILSKTLPYTDIFLPSIEEIVFMLDREKYNDLKALSDDILENITIEYIAQLGAKILSMGCKIVVLKCGTLGYFVKTADAASLKKMGRGKPEDINAWADRELFSGIFKVNSDEFKSATGAGDTSIAAFLTSILKNYRPEKAISLACATGAICCTGYGAVETIIPIEQIAEKVESGWKKLPVYMPEGYTYNEKYAVYTK